MNHLFFASHFEAKPFITEHMVLINQSPKVYEGDYRVIIMETGLIQSAVHVTQYLNSLENSKNDKFINLGIAGSIKKAEIGSIFQIGRINIFCGEEIPESSQNIWLSSYPEITINTEGLHLATSLHPVWGNKFKSILTQKKIDLVDMEAYSFAMACKQSSVKPIIYKSVSDNLVKKSQDSFLQNAQIAIDSLHQYYSELK